MNCGGLWLPPPVRSFRSRASTRRTSWVWASPPRCGTPCPWTKKASPLTRCFRWLDLRSIKQADRVTSGEMPSFLFQHTGNIPTAKDSIPKILWLKEEMPEIWRSDGLSAGLQGIHPLQADRQDRHRLGGSFGLLPFQPVYQEMVRGSLQGTRHPVGKTSARLSVHGDDR